MTKYKLKTKYLLPLLGLGVLGLTSCQQRKEQYIIHKDDETHKIVGVAINPDAKYQHVFFSPYPFWGIPYYDLYQDGDTLTFRSIAEDMYDGSQSHVKTINGRKARYVIDDRYMAAKKAAKQEMIARATQNIH